MTLLILGGTGEGQQIARVLAARGADAILSLSGSARIGADTGQPMPAGLPTRTGGFGGADAFRAFLTDRDIHAVLDATHPFAAHISRRTAGICTAQGVPYCQLLRPPWTPGPGDRWISLEREEDAARHIPTGAVVFMTTGRQNIERFANLRGCRIYSRQIGAPDTDFPFEGGCYLPGTPPFSVEDERALFARLGVDWLIVKNAGGEVPRTKLIAARELGISVALLNRPDQPQAMRVETVDAALDWIAAR